jgi:hypothetical protein
LPLEDSLAQIPRLAATHKLNVCLGAYLSYDDARNAWEFPLFLETARNNPNVVRAIVGNETQHLGILDYDKLLGFLDEDEGRVGCLAHPAANGGVDLRDCGVYDVTTCDAFLCPSHAWLSEEEAAIAAAACGDFHLYGLVVTDVEFVRAALGGVADRAGARVELRHLEHAPFRAALRELFALKEELAPGSDGLFGAFRPGADGEPVARRIDYEALGRAGGSAYDRILTCVGADPRSGNDLEALEAEVRRRLDACAGLLDGAAPRPTDPEPVDGSAGVHRARGARV